MFLRSYGSCTAEQTYEGTDVTDYERAVTLWKEKNIRTAAELAEALNSHRVAFAYHSGKIENDRITYNDIREIFDHDGVTSYTGDLRTLFEIRNAKEADELFLSAFDRKRKPDESLVKEFQEKLTQNTYDPRRYQMGERPGTFKLHDYVTGRNEVGAAPEDVKEELDELLEELQEIPDDRILVAAAYFHVKFENIHPFSDGNGRTGRILMNYLLILHNHPLIIIHEEDRKEYYAALEAWDERQELEPMITFLKQQTVKTWEKQLQRRKKGGA